MAGHRKFNELVDNMPPERRARSDARVQDFQREMLLAEIGVAGAVRPFESSGMNPFESPKTPSPHAAGQSWNRLIKRGLASIHRRCAGSRRSAKQQMWIGLLLGLALLLLCPWLPGFYLPSWIHKSNGPLDGWVNPWFYLALVPLVFAGWHRVAIRYRDQHQLW